MRRQNLTEIGGMVSHISAGSTRAAGSYVGEAVDATLFQQLVALIEIGTLAGAATLTGKWQHCAVSASDDSTWADIDSTSCITSAFASGSNGKVGELVLRADQHSAIKRYVRPYVSAATSTWAGGVTVWAQPSAYTPGTSYDSADVVQTVVY